MPWPSLFFSSLKKERIRKRIYKTRDMARANVFDYIEVFYNRIRRYSHLGGVSPEAFERASLGGWKLSVVARAVQLRSQSSGCSKGRHDERRAQS
ncbi:hypothetical protein BLL42_28500 (plasmid) [Pseudomonas frederiksbergensis]|uniref:Integrase catalytic domain-containing protein n=1 Tax=Pseudomonas frederiksbergensis TaxID=104087 RepID=A0A1J0EUT6_9PSED|nr:hypothetical protein BLL42_28500 [Pseudomonas frederiksbergensis]